MKKSNVRLKHIVIFVTIVAIIMSGVIALQYLHLEKKRNIERTDFIAESEANKLQYAIDSRLLNLEILEMLIVENNGMIDDFEGIASILYEQDPAIRCIQLAPDGVIRYIYPLEGNETGFGNLFANPDRRDEAIYARDTGNMTLAGPFELHQGGIGVVCRRPIYLYDEDGKKNFWGFSIQVMDLPGLFDHAGIEELEKQGYDYQLWRYMPNSNEKHIFAGNEEIAENAIQYEIEVPGNTWYLRVIPQEGYISVKKIVLSVILALFIDILIIIIAYYMITTEKKKYRLLSMVKTDQLTGLYSSRHFYVTLDELAGSETPFSVFYIDLDRFKQINDRYGHVVGDKILSEAGRITREALGDKGRCFRIGGDEFVALVEGCQSEADKLLIKKTVKDAFSENIKVDDILVDISASCGYASYPDDAEDITELLHMADQNMYREKYKKIL